MKYKGINKSLWTELFVTLYGLILSKFKMGI